MKVLELFSGIGGMHYACKEAEKLSNAQLFLDVVTAVDINTSANSVYRTNFPGTKLLGRNIQALSVDEIVALSPEVVLMSPPCQPFTRTGLKKDLLDARCDALSYLIQVLPHIPSLKYLLLENVKGFEHSQSRDLFTQMLTRAGFKFQELLLSPTQFEVPNSRTRYYLIAKKCIGPDKSVSSEITGAFCFDTSTELITSLPRLKDGISLHPALINMTLQSILDTTEESDPLYQKYRVNEKDLVRRFNVFDIVSSGQPASCTNCFTKAYTHYAEGTGSVLSNLKNITQVEEIIEKAKNLSRKHEEIDDFISKEETITKKQKLDDEKIDKEIDVQKEMKNKDYNKTQRKETKDETCGNKITDKQKNDINNKNTTEEKTSDKVNELEKKRSNEKSKDEDNDAKTTESLKLTTNPNKTVANNANLSTNENVEILSELSKLNLRYFSPNEIRKLMCFPDSFLFPPSCTDKSKYKLLGNSINVHVVAYCICLMLFEGDH